MTIQGCFKVCCMGAGQGAIAKKIPMPEKILAPISNPQKFSHSTDQELVLSWLSQYAQVQDVLKATQEMAVRSYPPEKNLVSHYDMGIEHQLVLRCPANAFYYYLDKNIDVGEYLVQIEGSYVALIKDAQGGFYLFEPQLGCVNLRNNEKWFITLLVAHKAHLSEKITLYKMGSSTNQSYTKEEFVAPDVFDEPECVFEDTLNRWGKAHFSFRGQTHEYVRDCISQDIYNDDSENLVRFKCAALVPATAFTSAARVVSNIAMGVFHLFTLPYKALTSDANTTITKTHEAFQTAARCGYFGFYGLRAAFYGLVYPYDGRRIYSQNERAFNMDDKQVNRANNLYLALCFLPLNCNVQDKSNKEMNVAAIKKTILWRQYFST